MRRQTNPRKQLAYLANEIVEFFHSGALSQLGSQSTLLDNAPLTQEVSGCNGSMPEITVCYVTRRVQVKADVSQR